MKWLLSSLMLLAAPAWAQDLQGNDTPSNWRVTHHGIHDIWNTICDERDEYGTLVQRCYMRRAEVFSFRPKFGAQFMFITPEAEGYKVDFGIELGTLFPPNGFRIEANGETTWRTRYLGCLLGWSCTFTGDDAQEVIDAMRTGDAFRFSFVDRYDQRQDLSWSLASFDAAWQDFLTQSQDRGLMAVAGN